MQRSTRYLFYKMGHLTEVSPVTEHLIDAMTKAGGHLGYHPNLGRPCHVVMNNGQLEGETAWLWCSLLRIREKKNPLPAEASAADLEW